MVVGDEGDAGCGDAHKRWKRARTPDIGAVDGPMKEHQKQSTDAQFWQLREGD